jgi:hypothetical protein
VQELLEIPGPGPDDPEGRRLAAVINAQRRAEDWAARRVFYARVVVVLSAAMAYVLLRGRGLASPSARFVLALWTVAFGALLACFGATLRAERRVEQLLAQAGGRRVGIAESE